MHKSGYKMRKREHIFKPSRLAEIPIVAVISMPPPPPPWSGPQAHRASQSRLLPSARHKYVLTASFSDDPGARCRLAS